jgi:hypothetical protein
LELFPNSLYLEKSQKNLINLKNKRSENLWLTIKNMIK